jgi:hypothetical protein
MDDERWEPGMPVLDRQAVRTPPAPVIPATTLPPSLRGLPPRSVPEVAPTPLQHHYVLLSVPVLHGFETGATFSCICLVVTGVFHDGVTRFCICTTAKMFSTQQRPLRGWNGALMKRRRG